MDPIPIEKICPIMPVKTSTHTLVLKKRNIPPYCARTNSLHTASKTFGLWSNEKPPNKGTPRLTRAITQALTKGASRA